MDKTTEVIIHTGIFDNIDKIFGKRADQEGQAGGAPGAEGGAPGGGGGGSLGGLGGGLGGDLGGLGGDEGGGEAFPPPGGEAAGGAPGEEGGEEAAPPEEEPLQENSSDRGELRPLMLENRISYDLNEMLDELDKLVEDDSDDEQ